jgi:hypothetical protein
VNAIDPLPVSVIGVGWIQDAVAERYQVQAEPGAETTAALMAPVIGSGDEPTI